MSNIHLTVQGQVTLPKEEYDKLIELKRTYKESLENMEKEYNKIMKEHLDKIAGDENNVLIYYQIKEGDRLYSKLNWIARFVTKEEADRTFNRNVGIFLEKYEPEASIDKQVMKKKEILYSSSPAFCWYKPSTWGK